MLKLKFITSFVLDAVQHPLAAQNAISFNRSSPAFPSLPC